MKTSRILMGALALAMVAVAVVGCKKEKNEIATKESSKEMESLTIYYNGMPVESFSEKEYVKSRNADMELTSIVDTNSINYFDQDALFKQFCKVNQMEIIYENNSKLDLIHQKAVELGLIDGDDESIPQDMVDYWQSVCGMDLESLMEPNRALMLKFYDGAEWDGQSMTTILTFRPKLGNMDNKVSSFTQYLGLGASVMCYDKWFGGTKRWFWCFLGPVNWTLSLPKLQQDDNQYSSYFSFLI